MKKLRFVLLSLAVLLTSGRAAAYDFESGGLFYNILDATALTVEVTSQPDGGNAYEGDITIPESVEFNGSTYRIVKIGNNAFYGTPVKTISFPSSLESFGDAALFGCANMKKLIIPENVTSIGNGAFLRMENLSVVISRIQTPFDIGHTVFGSTTSWTSSGGNTVYHNVTPSKATLYVPDGSKSLYQALSSWNVFSQIQEGEPYEIIVDGLIYSYINGKGAASVIGRADEELTDITIPGSVPINGETYIVNTVGEGAFRSCGLESLVISEGIETIGQEAFMYNHNLKSLELPKSLKTIGNSAFYDSYNLKYVELPEGVESIGQSAFGYVGNWRGDVKVVLPSTLTSIGESAFQTNNTISNVTSRIKTPFEISQTVFCTGYYSQWDENEQTNVYTYNKSDATLYVPDDTKSLYQAIAGWNMFAEIVEGELMTAPADGLIYSYIQGKGVATVIGRDNEELRDITIPANVTINGSDYSVKAIGARAFYDISLNSVTIEDGIETIEKQAFWDSDGINTLVLPSTLKTIGDEAFTWAYITTLTLPEGLVSVGRSAFSSCGRLTRVVIPSTVTEIGENVFNNCGSLTAITSRIETPYEISESVFSSNTLATLYVPVGTLSIYQSTTGWNVFADIVEGELKEGVGNDGFNYSYIEASKRATLIKGEYSSMLDVSIPATTVIAGATYKVVGISSNVFENMSVRSVKIAEGVETIGNYAFRYCYSLQSVSLPESITRIGDQAFSSCNQLDTISIPGRVETIGNNAFSGCRIKEVVIPASTKAIGNNTFYNCNYIASIRVDAGNTVYDSRNNCNALIESTSNKLIKGCSSTVIPNSVVVIENHAFGDLNGLTGITIPNSVTRIEYAAFYSCRDLTSIYIPSSVEYIGSEAFSFCTSLNSIKVDQNNSVFDSRNDCNAIIETKTNKLVVGCAKTIVPRGVKIIGQSAFRGCSGIDSLRIVGGVETIEYNVFDYSHLQYIEIPNSIKSIGGSTFQGCTELRTIVSKIKDPSSVNVNEDVFNIGHSWVNGTLIVLTEVATLYVPKGKKELYQQTSPWSNFANIVEMDGDPLATPTLSYDGRAVTATTTDENVDMYYSTDGSEPSTYYEGPIPVSDLGTVKVMAEKTFRSDSETATYEIKYLYTGDTLKVSEAGLMAEAIKWCGNDSVVKMTVVGPISPDEFTTIRGLKNLQFLNLAEAKIEGLAIPDNAFANSNIVSFVAPSTIGSVGSGIFSGCQQLAAVNWATDKALPSDALSGVTNPNLLLYLNDDATAPAGINNVVIGGQAEMITLVDATGNNNFYCPVPFSAKKVTYTRNFQQQTEVGVSRGWETIVLPFKVDSITHEKFPKDILLVPFNSFYGNNNRRPFWLYTLEQNNISAASNIQANVPYLICMPNDDVYGDQYILSGNVTFIGTNVNMAVSVPQEKSQGDVTFVPAYQRMAASADVFTLNVNQEYKGYPAGSLFVSNFREVRPFEAYSVHPAEAAQVAASRIITVSSLIGGGGNATGIEDVMLKKQGDSNANGADDIVKVYSLSGALIKQGQRDEVLRSLPRGVYIVNGKKMIR